jgi:solute carrier family 25 carnitine/acylcarnitine transporter 20/29
MLAGSMAGAVGVGLSFPLDTVNTRSQLNALAEADQQKDKRRFHPFIGSVRVSEKTGGRSRQTESQQQHSSRHDDLVATAISIYRREGWRGFFSGARGMVAGESVIKAVAFGANSVALAAFQPYESGSTLQVGTTTPVSDEPSALALFAAACFAGTMAAFVVAPVERIKVVMQSSPQGMYRDEIECLRAIWKSQGPRGLLQGLDATIARDMPGYGLYFAIYEALTQNCDLGPVMSPALFGAAAGSASWIPVYPIDTVKTLLQRGVYNHTYVPSSSSSCTPQTAWQIIAQLYAQGGPGAFYRGLTPKLLRSAVNHAATFAVYESMMENLRQLAA